MIARLDVFLQYVYINTLYIAIINGFVKQFIYDDEIVLNTLIFDCFEVSL